MSNPCKTITALALAIAVVGSASATSEGLDGFFGEVNLKARADLGAFKADLSATFGVSEPKIEGLFRVMATPADVYMTLRIGELAKQPVDRVVAEYKANSGKGWGVIAKNLGIKPGSEEFHALKEGRLSSHGRGGSTGKKGKDKGKR